MYIVEPRIVMKHIFISLHKTLIVFLRLEYKYDITNKTIICTKKEIKGSNSRIIFKQKHEKDAILYFICV